MSEDTAIGTGAKGTLAVEAQWLELRDSRGRLYARIDERRLLLEVSYHRERVTFDLRDYLKLLRRLENSLDIE